MTLSKYGHGHKHVKLCIIFSTLFAVDHLIVFLKTEIIACKNLDVKLATKSWDIPINNI